MEKLDSQTAYEALESYIHEQVPMNQLGTAQRIIARLLDRMTPEQRAEAVHSLIR